MKQQLWQLNSSLLGIFLFLIIINFFFLKKSPPSVRRTLRRDVIPNVEKKTETTHFDIIFNNDLFDTYRSTDQAIAALPLVGTIPEPKFPPMFSLPEIKKPALLPPLSITLKGILFTYNENSSVALIEDEAAKESSYYVGDQIKDGILININREQITILRSNGQHENLSLKKESLFNPPDTKSWSSIIQKTEEGIVINPYQFVKAVPSAGILLDQFALATVYKNNKPFGLRINNIPSDSCLGQLDLKRGDIVTAYNDIPLTTPKNRMKAYNEAQSLTFNSHVKLSLIREGTPQEITYKLAHLEESPPFIGNPPSHFDGSFNLSNAQKRAENIRMFNQTHKFDRESTLEALRAQLLENMKKREQNARVR